MEKAIDIVNLAELVRNSPSAQLLLDHGLKCVTHSHAWLAELGLSRNIEPGRPLYEAFPACSEAWSRLCAAALEGRQGEISKERYVSSERGLIHLRLIAQPCAAGVLLTAQGLDEQLRARQAINEATRLKTEFFATMSHEIRTPLNAITGMAELLLDTSLGHEQREWVAVIRTSGDSLLSVINDLLDFSRIESGKLLLEPTEFSPVSVIEDTAELFAARAHEKGLELFTFISPELPERLRGDAGRLGQVLLNLTSNAVKFTHQGEVLIRAYPESRRPGWVAVRFEVSDSGIGISDANHARIFEPFTQGDGSMTRRYGGTGLGLSLSQRLVHLMGGRMGCESVEGHGSTFSVTIEFEVVHASAEAPTGLANKRVLIADENPQGRRWLQAYLGHWGLVCDEATSVAQAWELLAGSGRGPNHYAAVLVNLSGPGGGLSFAKSIRSAFGNASPGVGVLLLPHERIVQRDVPHGSGIACLSKPLRRHELWSALIEMCRPSSKIKSKPSRSRERRPSARRIRPILVVEDNPVNRQVALLQLSKLGYSGYSVANGLEAVEAYGRSSFSLILMDCQMPEMDGFEATRAIRRLEGAGRDQVPIIAMTANAMLGDREKCLASGMDDYIAKPVTKEHLEKVLTHWLKGESEPVIAEATAPTEEPVLDVSMLSGLRELQSESDSDVLKGLIDIYLSTTSVRLEELYRAVRESDAKLFKRTAHTLKSSCAQLGARRMATFCRELEHRGSASLQELASMRDWLSAEYARVKEALRVFCAD